MLSTVALLVILNGEIVAGVRPPVSAGAAILAPLVPVVARMARRITVEAGGEIAIDGDERRCTFRVGVAEVVCGDTAWVAAGAPELVAGSLYLPLGDVVRALGGELAVDPLAQTVNVLLPPARGIASPPPLDPAAPQGAPPAVTPAPSPTPTPRPVENGTPRPRRTALPAGSAL